MNKQTIEQFSTLSKEMLSKPEGGKTIYYGNGLYCNNQKGCWVNWPEAINIIANNSAMNLLTGGNAGWHSGGPL
ncbi:leucocin A/sakacin P family class II bacteriocin [Streptococcus merionis]|uniref:leucocin A/sakacin P family class II bacteriocin n=1 Tax=Streptococcus merionis TaxID=400065 RepID=UPI00351327DD